MTAINVQLSGEDINAAVADAIVKSVLGDTIVRMVNEYVKTLSHGWDNPVKKVVEQTTRDIIVQLIHERRADIRAEVNKQLSAAVVTTVVGNAIEKLVNR